MTVKKKSDESELSFLELTDQESQKFIKGSARIALETTPRFKKYVFIEKDSKQFLELEKLIEEFPDKKADITLASEDANDFLLTFCSKTNWSTSRAVLFLDPFAMQVNWKVIEAIAKTKAIDLWYLFPINAVTRLLKKDGRLDPEWEDKLTSIFGEASWRKAFYSQEQTLDLFQTEPGLVKTADYEKIEQYMLDRLRSLFVGVAPNPARLLNSKNNPLFLLCFACGNEKGMPIALRIANHILKG